MRRPVVPNLRSIHRLNQRVHDPIADWLGAVLASFLERSRPGLMEAYVMPERQDLYGFSENHSPESFKR